MTISRQKKHKIIELLIFKKTYREISKFLKVSNTTIQNCYKELQITNNKYPSNKDTIKVSYIAELLFSNKENRSKKFGYYQDIALNCIKELEIIRNNIIKLKK